jgi:3D (Asp-Asp-Asp) domain-containing protein
MRVIFFVLLFVLFTNTRLIADNFIVTAYSKSRSEGTDDGITATGLPADVGIAAVDPRVIPLGSIIWVEGYGYAIAADTGGKIKGKRVDVFFRSTRQALKFGRAKRKVKIIARPTK